MARTICPTSGPFFLLPRLAVVFAFPAAVAAAAKVAARLPIVAWGQPVAGLLPFPGGREGQAVRTAAKPRVRGLSGIFSSIGF